MKKILVFSLFVIIFISFTYGEAVYKISSPNGSQPWFRGNTIPYKILWDKKGDTVQKVKIRLFRSPGMIKECNITDSADNDGSFDFFIPGDLNSGYFIIRVKNLENSKWGDSKVFMIKGIRKDVKNTGQPELKSGKSSGNTSPVWRPKKGSVLPHIRKFSIIGDEVKPGSVCIIKGSNFGKEKGKVLIASNLMPGGKIEAEIIYWNRSTKSITCKGPEALTGIKPHTAKFYIVTANNLKSNSIEKAVSGWETKMVVGGVVSCLSCGGGPDVNGCFPGLVNATLSAHHIELPLGESYSGSDSYQIILKNGWVFKSYTLKRGKSSSAVLSGPFPALPTGQSEWSPIFNWSVRAGDTAGYDLYVYAEGPYGTDYK